MNTLLADLRVGVRLLWRDKAFTVTAGLTLAVCIGANIALFSVVRGVLLKPLAMPEPDRVLVAGNVYPGAGVHEPIGAAVPDYFDRLRDMTVFAEQALFRRDDRSVDQGGTPANVEGMTVTPSFFRVAGVEPQMGRTFTDQEGEIGNEFAVVLSDSFWRNQFGGEPSVVGRDLRLDGRPYTVVGVMPRGFDPTDDEIELWTPMTFTAEQKSDEARHSNNAIYIARLKPGATLRTGTGADRRVERREPRSIPAVQRGARQCRLPHCRQSTAGPDGQGRQSHALPDVGRGALRAADRLRQRRQPCTRAVARADEGAGHAAGSWRWHVASRAPARR